MLLGVRIVGEGGVGMAESFTYALEGTTERPPDIPVDFGAYPKSSLRKRVSSLKG